MIIIILVYVANSRTEGSYFTLVGLSRMEKQTPPTLKQTLIYCAKLAKIRGLWGIPQENFEKSDAL